MPDRQPFLQSLRSVLSGSAKGRSQSFRAFSGAHLILKIRKLKAQKAEEDAHPTVPVTFAEALYKNEGYTYGIACELYCKQFEKNEKTLTEEDKKIIWGNSYDDFAYLLMWIFENNYYQPSAEMDEDDIRETRNFIARIKRHTKTPADFLEGSEVLHSD